MHAATLAIEAWLKEHPLCRELLAGVRRGVAAQACAELWIGRERQYSVDECVGVFGRNDQPAVRPPDLLRGRAVIGDGREHGSPRHEVGRQLARKGHIDDRPALVDQQDIRDGHDPVALVARTVGDDLQVRQVAGRVRHPDHLAGVNPADEIRLHDVDTRHSTALPFLYLPALLLHQP